MSGLRSSEDQTDVVRTAANRRWLDPKGSFLVILAVFIASRIIYHLLLDVRFNHETLFYYFQYIDLDLLRTRLLESAYYAHGNPPLFNLFLGLVVKGFGSSMAGAFFVIYLIFGLGLAYAIHELLLRLGCERRLALGLTLLFVVSPTAVLYENWLFYPYPTCLLLCLGSLLLHRYVARGTPLPGLGFFFVAAAVTLIRSTFHLFWLLALAGLVLVARRDLWRRTLLIAAVPLMCAAFVYGKNYHHYGTFSTSSWFGMSFAKMVMGQFNRSQIVDLLNEGRISPLAARISFAPLEGYAGLYSPPRPTGIAVLDRPRKAVGGQPNYNHLAYVGISAEYRRNALALAKDHPGSYLNAVITALGIYFRPASDHAWLHDSRGRDGDGRIVTVERAFNLVMFGQLSNLSWFRGEREARPSAIAAMGLMLLVGLPLVFGYGVWRLHVGIRGCGVSRPHTALLGFVLLNIAYVTTVSNLFEVGENNRFRFAIDPLIVGLLGLLLTDALNWYRRMRATALPRQ
jgi:hypothetical protein